MHTPKHSNKVIVADSWSVFLFMKPALSWQNSDWVVAWKCDLLIWLYSYPLLSWCESTLPWYSMCVTHRCSGSDSVPSWCVSMFWPAVTQYWSGVAGCWPAVMQWTDLVRLSTGLSWLQFLPGMTTVLECLSTVPGCINYYLILSLSASVLSWSIPVLSWSVSVLFLSASVLSWGIPVLSWDVLFSTVLECISTVLKYPSIVLECISTVLECCPWVHQYCPEIS